MRLMFAAVPAALLMLGACAPAMTGDRYETELQRLTADCTARGGVLSPTGQQSGRPQLDNICKVTGQPSSRLQN